MRRFTSWLLLLGAVGCGVAASTLTYGILRNHKITDNLSLPRQQPARSVVVAAVPITFGTVLKAQHLKVVPWPAGVPQGAFSEVKELLDRVMLVEAVPDEPILAGKLAPKGSSGGLPAVIPKGKRAVSVRVNEIIGVAGFVLPRTRVDVLVSINAQGDKANSASRVILQNVEVLAAGQTIETDSEGKPNTVNVITLLVDPAEAEKLTIASHEGELQLALRNSLDVEDVTTPGAILGHLVNGPPPKKTKRTSSRRSYRPKTPPPKKVEVIRGNERTVQEFK